MKNDHINSIVLNNRTKKKGTREIEKERKKKKKIWKFGNKYFISQIKTTVN